MADDNSVYRDLFFEESDDNLQALNDNILELEQEPDNIDLVNNIFRVAHTLKGMSATMGYDVMTKLTHKMCTANNGASQLKIVAANKVVISAMLPTSKN